MSVVKGIAKDRCGILSPTQTKTCLFRSSLHFIGYLSYVGLRVEPYGSTRPRNSRIPSCIGYLTVEVAGLTWKELVKKIEVYRSNGWWGQGHSA